MYAEVDLKPQQPSFNADDFLGATPTSHHYHELQPKEANRVRSYVQEGRCRVFSLVAICLRWDPAPH